MQFAGALLVGLVALGLTLSAAASIRRMSYGNERRRLALELLRTQIETAKAARRRAESKKLAWDGYRKFVVDAKRREAEGVYSFYLAPHDRKPLPGFDPGQYLTFQFSIPEQRRPPIRCYSLSECPGRDVFRITVKKVLPPPDDAGAPPGLVSGYLIDQVQEGDLLDVKAPRGNFVLDLSKQTPVVFVAGGVGVTPFLSMLGALAESESRREAWLFYCTKNSRDHIMKEQLEQLEQEHEHLHVRVFYSHPLEGDIEGQDYHFGQRVSVDLLKDILPSNNYRFYVCGPPGMMSDITEGLKAWGVPAGEIHTEAFGPVTVRKAFSKVELAAKAINGERGDKASSQLKVTFGRSGKTLRWDPAAENLLNFAMQNDIVIEAGCQAGNCGTCLTAVRSGDVAYLTQHGAVPEDGSCLACISVPKTDLVLDA